MSARRASEYSLASLLLALLLPAALPVHAASTVNVTTTSMAIAADGQCGLREALQAARTLTTVNECAVTGGAPVTINLQAGATYNATVADDTDGTFGKSGFFIAGNEVIINGNGATLTQSVGGMRVLVVKTRATLRSLRISGGRATDTSAAASGWGGGALVSGGGTSLNVEDVIFSDNIGAVDAMSVLAAFGGTFSMHRSSVRGNGTGLYEVRAAQGSFLNIANSTIYGPNHAVVTSESSEARISNSLLFGNSFALTASAGTTAIVQNSIIAGNCLVSGATFTSTNNSSDVGACNPTRAAPALSALGFNGGSTETMIPQQPNASRDAASGCTYVSTATNTVFSNGGAITVDQRGAARSVCDVGPVETAAISPTSLPGGTVGSGYSQTISASGAVAPYSFAVSSGALPSGLNLAASGVLSGVTNAAGNFTFEVTVSDASNFKSTVSYTIAVAKGAQSLSFPAQTTTTRTYAPSGLFSVSPLATSSAGLTVTYSSGSAGVCSVSSAGLVTIVSTGTCVIRADQAGDSNYNAAATATQSVTITQAAQSLTWGAIANQAFVASGTFTIAPLATSSAGLSPITYASTTPAICTVSGTTVTMVSAGTCGLSASQAGNANYSSASATNSVVVDKAAQTLTFGAQTAQVYAAGGTFNLNPLASSSAGLTPIVYSVLTPAVCSISGTQVSILSAGTCTVAANQAGNASFSAAPQVTQDITIQKANQSISFGAQAGQNFAAGGSFALNPLASASSGLAASYTSQTAAVCTISGTTVSMLSAGTCRIAASQAGDGNYNAAPLVTQDILIGKGSQTLSFGAQPGRTFLPGGTFAISPTATSSVGLTPIVYASATPAVCTVSGTTVTLVAAGTCTITADQAGDSNYNAASQVSQSVIISKAAQTLSFGAQAAQTYAPGGSFSINPLATSSAGLTSIAYASVTPTVCVVSGTTVLIASAGTCTISANQAGNANYNAAPQVTQDVSITKAAQSITFGAQAAQVYAAGGIFAINPTATASSGLGVSYSSLTTAVCSVSGGNVSILTAGTCTIAANQAGDANYNAAAQVTQDVVISKASQSLTFGVQSAQVFAPAATFAINPLATASSGLTPVYSSATPGVCTVSGTTVTIVTAGTCTLAANQAGNINFNAAAQVTQDVTIAKANQTLTFGAQAAQVFAPGGSFAINPLATASSGLTPVYSSLTTAVCTVSSNTVSMLTAGTCTLAANQAGNGNYNAATQVTQDVTLNKAAQTLTFGAQAAQVFAPGGSFAINPLASASSGLTPVYSSLTAAVCTVSGTTVSIVTAGTCTLAANQAGDANYSAAAQVTRDVSITKAAQTLSFAAQSAQTYSPGGSFTVNPLATASSGLAAITYSSLTPAVCTITGTTVTIVASGTCTLAANQAGDGNYNAAAQVTRDIVINQAAQSISFATPVARAVGSLPFAVSVSGGASGNAVLVTSSTPTKCTATGLNGTLITLLSTGTCTLRATQAGNANYAAAADVTVSFEVTASTTVVKLTSSANPVGFGKPVTFTIEVQGVGPTGVVDLLDGIETVCAKLPVVNTLASCTLSNLAEGGHSMRAYYRGDANNVAAFSGELVQVVPKVGVRQGAWWGGPAEYGWGLSIMEHGTTLVVGWYFYDAVGNPTWLTLNGCTWETNGTRCTGPLMRSQASWFGAYRADLFRSTMVGTATLAFDDQGGLFSYVVDGVAGSKRIVRMDLGPNPYAPFDYTDVWWGGAAENGWGVSAHVAGQSLVGIWYTFDGAGQPTWFLFNNGLQRNPRTFQASLYRARGTPWNQPTNPAQYVATPVGEIYFDFDDVRNGTMTYQVDGLLQFKPFLRLPF